MSGVSGRRGALALAMMSLASCAGGGGDAAQVEALAPKCEALRQGLGGDVSGVEAALGQARAKMASMEGIERFDEVAGDFTAASQGLSGQLEAACAPGVDAGKARDQVACVTAARDTLGEIQGALTDPIALEAPRRVAWALEAKFSTLETWRQCEAPPSETPGVDTRGVKRPGGTLALQAEGAVPTAELTLTATLLCQRHQGDGSYVDVPDCHQATLVEDDRFKVAFKANRPAHFYVLLLNDAGQVQMLFPAPGINNRGESEVRYFMPPGAEWFVLDNVGGVIEHVQIIAADGLLPDLEALRGVFDGSTNASADEVRKAGVAFRGKIEPLIFRGVKRESTQQIKLEVGGTPVTTTPRVVSGDGVSVYEFEIKHGF